jgi:SAM-dependent methyltransferase
MKTRESGMPDEGMWEGFFCPEHVLQSLGLQPRMRLAVEFGCGYGTFCLPTAKMISGRVVGLDIEPDLVELCRRKSKDIALHNAEFEVRDFIAEGTGIEDGAADYVMLFNILHAERPEIILREARRILSPDNGVLAVMHWRHDPRTPRGPSLSIRPRPEDCLAWARASGFSNVGPIIDLPPWHYGFTAKH